MQSVWSKILVDLKNQEGDNIILIPIAVDSEISSLNLITHNFNITNYPVLIIDEKHLIYDYVRKFCQDKLLYTQPVLFSLL